MLKKLLDDHARIRELCAEMSVLIDRDTPCPLDVLADCRWRLTRLNLQHLPLEERYVYQRLEQHPDPRAVEIAQKSKNDLEEMFAYYRTYADTWTPERILERWTEYRDKARLYLARVTRRLDHEETVLYPLLASAPAMEPQRRPQDRNWAADCWSFKEKISGVGLSEVAPPRGS